MRPRFSLRGMRALHLTIAATLLAVPASAYAFTTATGHPAHGTGGQPPLGRLELRLSSRRVQFGRAVTITGTVPAGDAGKTVVLQTAPAGSSTWRRTAVTKVGTGGGFRFRALPRHSAIFRAVEPGSEVAAASDVPRGGAAVSAAWPVGVTGRFTIARHQFAVLGGSRLRVHGRLLPGATGRIIRLQSRTAAGWRTLARDRTGRLGGFGLSYSPSAGGARLRVLFGGDRGNARTTHSVGTVTVYGESIASWYYDAGGTACGFHAGLGVANRTLPCGTKVMLRYGGRSVTATVDDRGPYVAGRDWDLNQTTAAALDFAGVGTVWVSR